MKRIYVAGASAEVEMVMVHMGSLRRDGWHIAFDWTSDVMNKIAAGVQDRAMTDKERLRLAFADMQGVKAADVVWFLIPARGVTEGAWVELGAALAQSKRIVVSGDHRRSIFSSLAERQFDTHDKARAWIGKAS